ncbi:MAG: hypothetical protein ACR2K3_07450 [Nocardioides sp.]
MSEQLRPARGPLLPAVLQLVVVVACFAAAGVVAGVLWELAWTPPEQIIDRHQIFYVDYASLLRVFSGTGLYVAIAVAVSALISVAVCLVVRRHELVTLGAVLVGSTLAAWLMRLVGVALGPDNPKTVEATARNGTRAAAYLVVDGRSPYLMWPVAALLVLAVVFFAKQRRRHVAGPGERPGHGSESSSDETGLVSDPHG